MLHGPDGELPMIAHPVPAVGPLHEDPTDWCRWTLTCMLKGTEVLSCQRHEKEAESMQNKGDIGEVLSATALGAVCHPRRGVVVAAL